jgi:predicted nucleic acid-binding protein
VEFSAKNTFLQNFLHPNLKLITVDTAIIMGSQKIIENFGLKPRDALHASATLGSGQSAIISDDDNFDAVKGLKRVKVAP